MTGVSQRGWTYAGLVISLVGIPAVVTMQHMLVADPTSSTGIIGREVAILALTFTLLWIVRRRECLPLSSIGFRLHGLGRSLAWGLILALTSSLAIVVVLATDSAFGVHYGEGAPISHSMAVTLLTVVRAGFSEELFYRGFAVERLQSLTGKRWLAGAISLIAFAGFHYRQGIAGIVLALVLGAIITCFYLWKRNLTAAIFAHFLVDFVPNVLLPLLTGAG